MHTRPMEPCGGFLAWQAGQGVAHLFPKVATLGRASGALTTCAGATELAPVKETMIANSTCFVTPELIKEIDILQARHPQPNTLPRQRGEGVSVRIFRRSGGLVRCRAYSPITSSGIALPPRSGTRRCTAA